MKARAKLMDQARKALYCLYRKLRNISIPIDLQFKLFDTLILSMLTYGSEIWGNENTKQLEKLHLQFCRNILGVRATTPNFMTYRELGRTPIDILYIKLRIVNFWNRLISNKKKLSCIVYKIMVNLSIIDNVQFKWLNFIKSIFEKTGLNYLWNQQQPVHSVQLKFIVKQNLTDQYIQNWFSQIENSSRGEFYGIFKNEFNLEKYLLKLLPHERNMITKFRCNNIKLPIETGRWPNTPREERICHLCNVGLGTEFHFLFECTSADVQRLRCKFIRIYYTRYANMYKMKGLLSLCNVKVLKTLSYLYLNCKMFCNYILRLYCFRLVISVIM